VYRYLAAEHAEIGELLRFFELRELRELCG
jgi:hypothetical protein